MAASRYPEERRADRIVPGLRTGLCTPSSAGKTVAEGETGSLSVAEPAETVADSLRSSTLLC